ncbi:MAG: polysaccharide export protein [Nitrococcus mobilis]|nr:polysaccharide export protein [Nitrococcus mobilis]
MPRINWTAVACLAVVLTAMTSSGCGSLSSYPPAPTSLTERPPDHYVIGPGDEMEIVVWGNPEVSHSVIVPPDGRINTPLVEDVPATGKTSVELARDLEKALSRYIKQPVVTVILSGFVGPYSRQIRVVGEAAEPQTLQFSKGMTVMDVMIAVGGLTEFADGNDASIIRSVNGQRKQYAVRLDDLLKRGDISANVEVLPGDVLIIPESLL